LLIYGSRINNNETQNKNEKPNYLIKSNKNATDKEKSSKKIEKTRKE
jgi:hypothetical protein